MSTLSINKLTNIMKEIERPIIIIGVPRSGTSLLFRLLASHPDLWCLYNESERAIFGNYFNPEKIGWSRGNQLCEEDASEKIVELLRSDFYKGVYNYQAVFKNSYSFSSSVWGRGLMKIFNQYISIFLKPKKIRIVEKTPRNCLRIPFINCVFPDAFFIYLVRDPHNHISALMEGWRLNGKFKSGYQVPGGVDIEGYSGNSWNFLLPPGWENYTRGKSLEEVCAFQYRISNQMVLESLEKIPEERKMMLKYEDLVSCSEKKIEEICDKTDLNFSRGMRKMAQKLPPVRSISTPDRGKWLKNKKEILSVIGTVKEVSIKMGYNL